TPEPGGLLPREVYRMLRLATREGLAGMEIVEVSPPYDVSDITALLGGRVVMEVLATLVTEGKLGKPHEAETPQAAPEQSSQPGEARP
ncbi:MAG TPA: arginase family protein, partial [Thermomicrobiales bacterium]